MATRKPVSVRRENGWIVEEYRNPPARQVKGYRRKKLEDGTVLTFAVLRKRGPQGGTTVLTSIKKPIRKKS